MARVMVVDYDCPVCDVVVASANPGEDIECDECGTACIELQDTEVRDTCGEVFP